MQHPKLARRRHFHRLHREEMQAEIDHNADVAVRVWITHCATPVGIARCITLVPCVETLPGSPRDSLIAMGLGQKIFATGGNNGRMGRR